MANKQYATVKNDYEMTLNTNSEVTEVVEEGASFKLPATTYNFTKIGELGQHISAKRFVGTYFAEPLIADAAHISQYFMRLALMVAYDADMGIPAKH
jgi:hypothetical protein